MQRLYKGGVYLLGDNIDTDQIISAEYMKYNPSTEEGYKTLGSLAMSGLPDSYPAFIDPQTQQAYHSILVAGKNFGCGSSREHAPVALAASGVKIVVAESFARIFFRNCLSSGQILPVQITKGICSYLKIGNELTLNFEENSLYIHQRCLPTKIFPLGDLADIVKYGGIFNYARKCQIIPA